MKIAFFHGLESPSISDKSDYLQNIFDNAYTPAMDYTRPGLFEEVLAEVKKRDIDLLVGSSMGGWFAYCISTLTGIPTLLFNPAFHSRSMDPKVKRGTRKAKHTVVLGKGDDVVNPYDTLSWIKSNGVGDFQTHFENNNHRTPIGIFRKWVGKTSVNEKQYVLGFTEFLKESSFGDDYPKNKFVELPHKDAIKYADDLFSLIQTAYTKKGGNLEIKSPSDLKNSDITYWILKDIDDDPDVDLTLGGKFTKHGVKMTIMGQDGSAEAKKDVVAKMIELMKTRGFYAEIDKELAQKLGLPAIRNEKEVRSVLNKELTWNNDGSYVRDLAGQPRTKVLVGIPK